MLKLDIYISILSDILADAKNETASIRAGVSSEWEYFQLEKVVIPEMSELLLYARAGEVYFKYGKKQRMLESMYLITDSLPSLGETSLGRRISELQKLYNSM